MSAIPFLRTFLPRFAGGLLLVGSTMSCGSDESAPADPQRHPASTPPAASAGGGTEPSAETPAPNAASAEEVTYRFEKDFHDQSDMGLGEVRTFPVPLLIEGAEELPALHLVSSCDCLSASFAEGPTTSGAVVEVRIDGHKIEDIDGVITVEDENRRPLAELTVRIVIERRPFVTPREVVLSGDQTQFQVTVGLAFPPEQANESFDVDFTDPPVADLVDWINEEEIEIDYVLKKMTFPFELKEEFRAKAFEEDWTFQVLVEPPQEFSVKIRREG